MALAAAALASAGVASAQRTDRAPARDALPGALRVGFAGAVEPVRLTGQLLGGYGFIEGAGGEGGDHHRLLGSAAVSVRPLPRLAVAIGADGRWDRHPRDDEGQDTSAVGVPWIAVRGSATVTEQLSIGADARLDVHGGAAPSFDPLASRLTLRVLGTARPTDALTIGIVGGVRFDGTGGTVEQGNAPRRRGDRVSLDVHDSNVVVLGLGAAWAPGPVELFGELTWEPPFGEDAPPIDRAAGRLAAGARAAFGAGFSGSLAAEVGFRSREPVRLDQLVEVEPRFAITLALAYRAEWAVATESSPPSPAAPPEPVASPAPPIPEPLARVRPLAPARPRTGALRGLVRDFAARPVVGASIRVDGAEETTAVDNDGAFELELAPGAHEVEVAADGYATQRRDVELEQNGVTILNVDLRRE